MHDAVRPSFCGQERPPVLYATTPCTWPSARSRVPSS